MPGEITLTVNLVRGPIVLSSSSKKHKGTVMIESTIYVEKKALVNFLEHLIDGGVTMIVPELPDKETT